MAGKKKLMITDQRIIHLLRHFIEIDFSYRTNLYSLGLDDIAITNEMMSGDYENLIEVFDREFGDFVILER